MLGGEEETSVTTMADTIWGMNVGHVLVMGEDVVTQQKQIGLMLDRLLTKAEKHNRSMEIEVETSSVANIGGFLRFNTSRFVVLPDLALTHFDHTWDLLRSARTVIRFYVRTLGDIRRADEWLLALAANPDGELTRSDHRIHARRRWLDVRTWVETDTLSLVPQIVDRRWNYSPNLWALTTGDQ